MERAYQDARCGCGFRALGKDIEELARIVQLHRGAEHVRYWVYSRRG